MTSLNLDSYFESSDAAKYYDPKCIITILESILGKSFEEIKQEVSDTQIVVTEDQIKAYLAKTFEEEDPELKQRLENYQPKKSNKSCKWTEAEIEEIARNFVDKLSAERYSFDPFTLEYIKNYIRAIRNKTLQLLNIIEKIGNKNSASIKDILLDLDIELDAAGNITREDIARLIMPTVYNINAFREKINKANDLATYLKFKLSERVFYLDLCTSAYPTEALQIKNIYISTVDGTIPLSKRQRSELKMQVTDDMLRLERKLDW